MNDVKVCFGIQKKHLNVIEDKLIEWDKNSNGLCPKGWALYREEFWRQVGQEIGWSPFTIALSFFEHKYK